MPIGPWFPSQLRGPAIGAFRDEAAPVNSVAPVASGTVSIGSTLSSTTGTWTGRPAPTFTYQWKRDGVSIGGATSSTYVVVAADIGAQVTCVVTATNSAGSSSATSNALQYTMATLISRVAPTFVLNQTGITLVSNRVSSWADQSGNAFDLSMATANMRPDGTTTLNSLVAPEFTNGDAVQDRLDGSQAISSIVSASAWHALIVFRLVSHTATDGNFYDEAVLLCDSGGFWSAGSVSSSGIHCGNWDGALKQTARTALSDSTNYLFESSFSGGTLSNRLGAGSVVTAASGNISTLTGTVRMGDRSSTGHLQGRVAFALVKNAAIGASDLADARAFATYTYGVAS